MLSVNVKTLSSPSHCLSEGGLTHLSKTLRWIDHEANEDYALGRQVSAFNLLFAIPQYFA